VSPFVSRKVADSVGSQVAGEADEIGWDRLPQGEKTAKLAAWVESNEIGGVLRPLLGGDAEVRLWLKDVALRRRSRRRQLGASAVAPRVLGERAIISIIRTGFKPSHALVDADGKRCYLAWGPHGNARNLFWAAMNAALDEPSLDAAYVVIVDSSTSTTPSDRRARFRQLASRAGLSLAWITV
jgi:hypothetical protein